jgi:long-chain acyl-CoA synthetase
MNPLNALIDAPPRDALALIALGDRPASWSYRALSAAIAEVAERLSRLALPAGALLAIDGGNRAMQWISTLAAWRLGLVVLPIGDDGGVRLAERLGAAAVLSATPRPSGLPMLALDGSDARPLAPGVLRDPALVLVMATSGSTAQPKAVPIRATGYAWALDQFDALRPLVHAQRVLVAAPLHHMNAQFHSLLSWRHGGTLVLLERYRVAAFAAAIEQFAIDRVSGVPTMLAQLLRAAPRARFPRVKSVAMGSAPLVEALREAVQRAFPNAQISNGWGTTETGPAAFGAHPEGLPTPALSIGAPQPGIRWRLNVDEVLELRTPMTLTGYLDDAEASARALSADGYFVTGDVMQVDANGFFFYRGRVDDRLQVGGENLPPERLEALLEQHPSVRAAAVVGLPDPHKHEVPVAYVVLNDGAALDEAALKAFALQRAPPFVHPRHVAALAALPLNLSRKLDRRALKARALQDFPSR